MPLLLSRMKEVGKVFLATNSDYNYTDVSGGAVSVPPPAMGSSGQAGALPSLGTAAVTPGVPAGHHVLPV